MHGCPSGTSAVAWSGAIDPTMIYGPRPTGVPVISPLHPLLTVKTLWHRVTGLWTFEAATPQSTKQSAWTSVCGRHSWQTSWLRTCGASLTVLPLWTWGQTELFMAHHHSVYQRNYAVMYNLEQHFIYWLTYHSELHYVTQTPPIRHCVKVKSSIKTNLQDKVKFNFGMSQIKNIIAGPVPCLFL